MRKQKPVTIVGVLSKITLAETQKPSQEPPSEKPKA